MSTLSRLFFGAPSFAPRGADAETEETGAQIAELCLDRREVPIPDGAAPGPYVTTARNLPRLPRLDAVETDVYRSRMDVALLPIEGGKANALTPELLDVIERKIEAFEHGPSRSGVLIGYERYFSAGLALTHIIDFDRDELRGFIQHFSRVMSRIFVCRKPLVAAINGHAIAGGCVMALMCDVRIAADDPSIRIGLNESQLGIGLPAIVVEGLRFAVPPASFVPIAMEGTLHSPARSLALGLVSEIAPGSELLSRSTAVAQTLAAPGAAAVAQIKRALRLPSIETVTRTSDLEVEAWLDTWFSTEAQQHLRAAVARLRGAK